MDNRLYDITKDQMNAYMRIKKSSLDEHDTLLSAVYDAALDKINEDYSNVLEVEEEAKDIYYDMCQNNKHILKLGGH